MNNTNPIQTKIPNFTLRFAQEKDIPIIFSFIKDLASFEKLSHEVTTNEAILLDSLFNRKAAEVIIGEFKNEPVAFALFFHNFSTFMGKPGIYLEDLYVKPAFRKFGYGKTMLAFLGKLAIDRDCGRMEWWCLDWNSKSINFYKKFGAEGMNDWTVYRLTGKALSNIAHEF
jgi:GNAT superfamily N-acetyltransferase